MVTHVTEGAGGALTPSTYTLLFPLLASAVLTDPHAVKQPAAAAFALVKKHCGATVGGAWGSRPPPAQRRRIAYHPVSRGVES